MRRHIQTHCHVPIKDTMKYLFAPLVAGIAIGSSVASAEIGLTPISSTRSGVPSEDFDQSAAEIVSFDCATDQMYVVNGASDSIDIFDVSELGNPLLVRSVDLSQMGNPNSVAINPNYRANEVAVAVGASEADQRGHVVFLNKNGDIVGKVEVGYLPDMLTYGPRGRRLVVANEGEPNADYSFDPEGSISIIEARGFGRTHRVTEVGFGGLTEEDVAGVRISGPEGTTIAQDIEPEYVAIDEQGRYAYVTCQENNAVAKFDLFRKRLIDIFGLGSIDHSEIGNALDASDKDDMIRIANWPVKGLPMPDSIAVYSVREKTRRGHCFGPSATYFVTANEGDAREYGDYEDETRIKNLDLDPSAFPLAETLQQDENIGRLAVINTQGDIGNDGEFEQLFSFGTRSFSIFSDEGELIFDSGEMIETWLAENAPEGFNSTNSESGSDDSRSDAKGPEPEAIEIGTLGDTTYAFVGLERIGGVMVFDITDPRDVSLVTYVNNRDFDVEFDEDNLANVEQAGDLGPEGLDFVPAASSPNGKPLLIVANEVSGTTTIYQISETAE